MFIPSFGRRIGASVLLLCLASVSYAQGPLPSGSILISHLSPDYGLSADEFVVLYNAGPDTAHLAGYEVRYATASGSIGSAGTVFTLGQTLPPNRHLLLASRETVSVGSVTAVRDVPFASGLAATGGQLLLRRVDIPDSIVYSVAWGTVSVLLAGMTDAATWPGDGMLSLTWDGSGYVRTGFNVSNLQYAHTPASSISILPSLHPIIPPSPWTIGLIVRQGEVADTSVLFGMSEVATDSFDIGLDLPAPPPLAGLLSAGVVRPDLGLATGELLLRDLRLVRPLADAFARWDLAVTPGQSGAPLSIELVLNGMAQAMPVRVRSGEMVLGSIRHGDTLMFSLTPQGSGPLELSVSIGDTIAPSVEWFEPNAPTTATAGSSLTLRARIADGSGIDSVRLTFLDLQAGSELLIQNLPLAIDSIRWTLPARLLTDSASFRLDAVDHMGNRRTSWSSLLKIVPDTARRSFTAGWHLVSSPLDPIEPAQSAIVGDSAYLFSYFRHAGYRLADSLVPGRGYFLGLLRPRTVRVVGIAAPDSVALSLAQGFNLISSPGTGPTSRADLTFSRTGDARSYAEALSSGWIGSGLLGFDPSSHAYMDADSLRPWSGYWIPVLVDGLSLGITRPFEAPNFRIHAHPQTGWRVRLFLTANAVTDSLLTFGTSPSATNAFDAAFDMPAPPPPPAGRPFVAWFDHPEWSLPTGRAFLSDIRSAEAGQSWTVTIRAETSATVTAWWRSEGPMDIGELTVSDPRTQEARTWRTQDPLIIPVAGTTNLSFGAVVTGVHAPDEVPVEFSVDPCYPNPFNPSTQLVVHVPRSGMLVVRVFDLLGREVARLFDGTTKRNEMRLTWNSRAASGVYVLQAEFVAWDGERHLRSQAVTLVR